MDFILKKNTHDRLLGVTHLEADRELLKQKAPQHDLLKRGIFNRQQDASSILFALLDFATEDEIVTHRRTLATVKDRSAAEAERLKAEEEEAARIKSEQEAAEAERLKAELEELRAENEELEQEKADAEDAADEAEEAKLAAEAEAEKARAEADEAKALAEAATSAPAGSEKKSSQRSKSTPKSSGDA